jgi:hypothetical protein
MGRKGCLNQDFQDFRMIRIIGGDGLVRVDGMDILRTGLLPCPGYPVETTHALSPMMVARSTKIGDLPHPFLSVTRNRAAPSNYTPLQQDLCKGDLIKKSKHGIFVMD